MVIFFWLWYYRMICDYLNFMIQIQSKSSSFHCYSVFHFFFQFTFHWMKEKNYVTGRLYWIKWPYTNWLIVNGVNKIHPDTPMVYNKKIRYRPHIKGFFNWFKMLKYVLTFNCIIDEKNKHYFSLWMLMWLEWYQHALKVF